MTSSGSVYYYHADQIGNTRALTDSTGTVQDAWAYDPYGNVTSSTGSIANPFQFQGQLLDMTSGLYFMRARWYDATGSAFISVDPASSSTRAAYPHTNSNPVNWRDITGLDFSSWLNGLAGSMNTGLAPAINAADYGLEWAAYQSLEVVSFVLYTIYYFAWRAQGSLDAIDPAAASSPIASGALSVAHAFLYGCQTAGLSGDETIDRIKSRLEQTLGLGSESDADEGFVGHIGPHQTAPVTYLPGKHPSGYEDLRW